MTLLQAQKHSLSAMFVLIISALIVKKTGKTITNAKCLKNLWNTGLKKGSGTVQTAKEK
jgi:hypothetical protein